MNKLQVSVSITTYNHENYIHDCLQSVIDQKCDFNFEVVVAEDCSTDNTRAIIAKFFDEHPNIIRPIYQKTNVGIIRNTSDVLEACSGVYIATLDGDDCMLPGRLQKQVDFLEQNPDVAIVFHNMQMIGEKINKSAFNNSLDEKGCIITMEQFVAKGLAHWGCSSKMYRRAYLPPEGISSHLEYIEDQYFHLQIARYGKVAYMPAVLGQYRKHDAGLSQLNKTNIEGAVSDLVYTYTGALRFGINHESVARRLAFVYYDAAGQYLTQKQYKDFRHAIEKSFENSVYFNLKHKIMFLLRRFPRLLCLLKVVTNHIYRIRGKQII